jgi:hypothetical protein
MILAELHDLSVAIRVSGLSHEEIAERANIDIDRLRTPYRLTAAQRSRVEQCLLPYRLIAAERERLSMEIT